MVEDICSKITYAAKCIEKDYLINHKNGLGNLIQEIQVLSMIDHPCVVPLYFVYETRDCIYLIMEYFPKGDLYKRITQKKAFSEDVCIKFAVNLLETLDFLQSKNIVHRDLKLENIMMTSDNDYDFKIIDFGLSYESIGDRRDRCGSPGYIAPEMLNKSRYNHRVDIFSAGVILYILLIGVHPFNAKSSDEILKRNQSGKYKKIKKYISEAAKNFILSMMAANPDQRPQIAELLDHSWIYSQRRESVCTLAGLYSTYCGSVIIAM